MPCGLPGKMRQQRGGDGGDPAYPPAPPGASSRRLEWASHDLLGLGRMSRVPTGGLGHQGTSGDGKGSSPPLQQGKRPVHAPALLDQRARRHRGQRKSGQVGEQKSQGEGRRTKMQASDLRGRWPAHAGRPHPSRTPSKPAITRIHRTSSTSLAPARRRHKATTTLEA